MDTQSNKALNGREFREGATRLESHPVKAWLAFTGRCNLNCFHCPRGSIGDRPPEGADISPELFSKVEEQVLPFLLECRVGGNNLGEQLLAKNWMEYSSRLGSFAFTRCLVTNGLLMNEEKAAGLVEHGWTVDFSTEGASKEAYTKIRNASFSKFIRSVKSFCETKAASRETESRARFAFTAFRDNIRELPALIDLAGELGVDEVLVTHLIPMSVAQREQSLVFHKGLANEVFAECIEKADEAGVKLSAPPMFSTDKTSDEQKPCLHPWTSVSIDEKGDVYPCCVYDEPMGNISDGDFMEVWNGEAYQELRRSVNTSKPPVNCRQCALRGSEFTSVGCSDEAALLGQIGSLSTPTFFLRLKLRQALAGTSVGRQIIRLVRKFL